MMEKFNEDMILQDMAFYRDLNRWASHARIQRVRDEGKQEGLKYSVLKLFQKRFSDTKTSFLDDLSIEQYEKIFDLLLEGANLEDIYDVIDKGRSD